MSDIIERVAIVGMSGAFPGARNVGELWKLLREGGDGISTLGRDELLAAGESPGAIDDPAYVPRGGFLEGADRFDHRFFGVSPAEALDMDPQQRLFLQHCYLALEDSGHDPARADMPVGVFAGEGNTQYWFLLKNGPLSRSLDDFRLMIGNDKDFVATRTSYKLNLKGPSFDIQSACSTSLSAVSLACQSLLTWGCDLALAGGVMITAPRRMGYLSCEGMIFSPTGACRPFDAKADGTLFGEGVGVVCLKRLSEAEADGDFIYAVIDAIAVNNDGSDKMGFTAPSVNGQGDVIEMAQAMAEVRSDDIEYVETHGTGTPLGDPIEVRALTSAFRRRGQRNRFCYLGSIKANIGHLDAASGIASLIKTALIVNTGIIPPMANFDTPNPDLKLETSPFLINRESIAWEKKNGKRIAGVSSFGIGGTNVHAIIESPPGSGPAKDDGKSSGRVLFGARCAESLKEYLSSAAEFLKDNPSISAGAFASKINRTRHDFEWRRGVAFKDRQELIDELSAPLEELAPASPGKAIFVFPGQGSQFPAMARGYYGSLPVFTEWIDTGLALAESLGCRDLRRYLLEDGCDAEIARTETTQPLLYIVEYALAKELSAAGIEPAALAGHSIGEYAAAAFGGAMSFEDGLRLVRMRGYLMQRAKPGAMLAVSMDAGEAAAFARDGISISVYNTENQVVLSGEISDVDRLEARMKDGGIKATRLKTSHAFHSPLMDEILPDFAAEVGKANFMPLRVPILSNLDGAWISGRVDWNEYWVSQLRQPVRFDLCIRGLAKSNAPHVIEAGPGRVLSGFIRSAFPDRDGVFAVLPNLKADARFFEKSLVRFWERGIEISWKAEKPTSEAPILFPGYPFAQDRFWPKPAAASAPARPPAYDIAVNIPSSLSVNAERPNDARSPSEILAEIWDRSLGASSALPSGDFFDAGGDSLIAIQFMQKIRGLLGIEIPVAEFLRKPSFSALEGLVRSRMLGRGNAQERDSIIASSIPARADSRQAPLSSQQERLWFLHEYDAEKPLYNLVHMVCVQGRADAGRLRAALGRFMGRHDLFRASFSDGPSGSPVLAFADTESIPVEEMDFSGLPETESKASLEAYIREKARHPLDFRTYPIVRAAICRLSAESTRVCLFVPHIFTDGWSSEIFLKEIEDYYRHQPDSGWALPALPRGYGDYAAWERQRREAAALPESLTAFWKDYLKGIPEAHDLPLDRPRPKQMSGLGSTLGFRLDGTLSQRVRALCEARSITPNMFFLSCLALILRKHQSQETIVIGAPYANREREEVLGLFGYFIRMIPLRFDVDQGMEAAAWLTYVKDQFLAAWEHSSIGLDEIVDLLAVPRTTNINPVYQILFAFQNYATRKEKPEDAKEPTFRQAFPDRGVSENDLGLYMWEGAEFEGALEYSSDIFAPESANAFLENFLRTIRVLAEGYEGRLDRINLMDETGWSLVERTNRTEEPAFLGRTVLDLFRQSLGRYPDAPAITSGDETLSYRELDDISDEIARGLVASGARPACRVGVYLNRDRWLLPSLLGIFKAGAAYVPLDPNFPRNRLSDIVADAQIGCILTIARLEPEAAALGAGVRVVCADAKGPAASASGISLRGARAEDTAYVLFTSGSTGKPKGVPILHGALANLLSSMRVMPGISERDVVLALTTITFDISTLELFLPLTCGARLVLADHGTSMDNARLISLIEEKRVTFIQATPSRWTLLLETGWRGKPGMTFLTGGEALPQSLAASLAETGAKVWNMYGPTETTVWSSVFRVRQDGGPACIGKPIANTSFFVLDKRGAPLPPGLPGELAIGGAGLSPGYLNRPDLSADRFIDIETEGRAVRVYKTGDLVQQSPSGDFRFLGRNDFQVKIRGFRIELEEIESVMLGFPGIREAACAVWSRSETDKRIVAYYRSSGQVDEAALKSHIKSALPEYMVPGHFAALEVFPRTSSGKTDRKALPAPVDAISAPARHAQKGPTDIKHETMLEIWREVLGRTDFGIEDSFFDLGGHSILATSLIQKINDEFGDKWKLRDLFEYPTIEGLLGMLGSNGHTKMPLLFPIRKQGKVVPIFLVAGVYNRHYFEDETNSLYEYDFLRYFDNILLILGNERPVYGLRPKGIYSGEKFHSSVEEMADEYIREIKAIQPSGPYLIGGECLGGSVAHAIANRMLSRGDSVQMLILFDCYRMRIGKEITMLVKMALHNAKKFLVEKQKYVVRAGFSRKTLRRAVEYLRVRLFPLTRKYRNKRYLERGADIYTKLLLRYRPRQFDGKTLLIINEEWNAKDPFLGWDSVLCPHLDVRIVPGNHLTRLTKKSDALARAIHESLGA